MGALGGPDTYYGSPEWARTNKALNDMHGPGEGPARENMSKALKIRKAKGGCSRFEGVHLHKASSKWLPRITIAAQVHAAPTPPRSPGAGVRRRADDGRGRQARQPQFLRRLSDARRDRRDSRDAGGQGCGQGAPPRSRSLLAQAEGKWVARITIAGKQHLGSYSIEEAARAYEKKGRETTTTKREDDDDERPESEPRR